MRRAGTRRVEAPRLEPADVVDLDRELAAEALDLAADGDRVAGLEPESDPVGLPEGAGGDRPAAIAEAQGEVLGAVAGRQPLLGQARVAPLEPLTGPQLGDLGMDLCDRRLHTPILNPWADEPAPRAQPSARLARWRS